MRSIIAFWPYKVVVSGPPKVGFSRVSSGEQVLHFYRIAVVIALISGVVSALFIYLGHAKSRLHVALFPIQNSGLTWFSEAVPVSPNGDTSISVNEATDAIDYSFTLAPEQPYAYTHFGVVFANISEPDKAADISRYDRVSFKVRCNPDNIFLFSLATHDERVTNGIDPTTRRTSSLFFPCSDDWKTIVVHLDELHTPDWWLEENGHNLTERGYNLSKVYAFNIINSLQSPRKVPSRIRITDLSLHGENRNYAYASYSLVLLCWVAYFGWLLRSYLKVAVADVKEKVLQDRPLLAYKELSIAPLKDKTKASVLRYMATEYANPELSLETIVASVGASRSKINSILKEEVGLTFGTYLNKLRLTEAVRLLSERPDVTVAEIAFTVGYNNVTYFNKLFKQEYGYSPKTFRTLTKDSDAAHPELPDKE